MRSSRALLHVLARRARPTSTSRPSSTKNASEPQMISLFSGCNGDGAFWQSSIDAALGELLEALLGRLVRELRLRRRCPAANAGAATTHERDDDAERPRPVHGCDFAPSAPLSAGDDEREDEAEERERLGERDAEEHRRSHGAGRLGLAGHRGDRVTDDQTDADAGADGGAAVDDASTDGRQTLVWWSAFAPGRAGDGAEPRGFSLLFLVSARDAWNRRCTRR